MKIRITKPDGKAIEVSGVVAVTVVEGDDLRVFCWNHFGFRNQSLHVTGQGFRADVPGNCTGLEVRDPALADPRPEVTIG